MTRTVLITLLASLAGCSRAPADIDSTPVAQYDAETGRLSRLTFSSSANGRNDAVGVMDGTRIHHIELDENHDGIADRWEFYDEDHRLVKVGVARRGDGVMDAVMFHTADGRVSRIEVSTRRDGRFDRIELYEAGALARVEEDTDGDTRIDKWESYRTERDGASGALASTVSVVAFDDDGCGTPDRRLVFGEDGRIVRVERDPDGDGIFTEQK